MYFEPGEPAKTAVASGVSASPWLRVVQRGVVVPRVMGGATTVRTLGVLRGTPPGSATVVLTVGLQWYHSGPYSVAKSWNYRFAETTNP